MPAATNILPLFSHIYVEEELFQKRWEKQTDTLLTRFPKAQVVSIRNYSEITQRRSSSWSDQKLSPKLVLAHKSSDLLYPCSDVAPNFGHKNFYYAVPMQNCLYDCEYCYLQGLYLSANLVYFLNQQDMIDEAIELREKIGPLYICIAYDNDILALENIFGVAEQWIEGLRDHPDITVEVRTKSANFRSLAKLEPCPNFILAWTLSPQSVVERFEAKTPPLQARLKAMKKALDHGWKVRLCLDPLLPVKNWKTHYSELLEEIDSLQLWSEFQDASYGLFRMPKTILRQAKKARPDSALLQSAVGKDERGLCTLVADDEKLAEFVGKYLVDKMGSEKVWRT